MDESRSKLIYVLELSIPKSNLNLQQKFKINVYTVETSTVSLNKVGLISKDN